MDRNTSVAAAALRVGQNAVEAVLGNLFAILLPLMVLTLIAGGIRNSSQWLVAHGAPTLALVFVLVCGLVFLGLLQSVTPERVRSTDGHIKPSFVLGLVTAIAFVWIYIFAVISYVLLELGWVPYAFKGSPANALPDLADAYLWYFLDLIPLHINQALGWPPDVDLTGGWRGVILTVFRIVIVYQVLKLGKKLLDTRKQETPPAKSA